MNWFLKAGVQAVLAHVPCGEVLNHQLQVCNGFYSRLLCEAQNNVSHLAKIASAVQGFQLKLGGARTVEVGTGWVPALPVGMYLLGAEVHSYDHVAHLRVGNIKRLLEIYPDLLDTLAAHEDDSVLRSRLETLRQNEQASIVDWLRPFGIFYHAPGDAAQTGFPPGSFDLYFSVNVFEHIPESAIKAMLGEAHRILRKGGLTYHHIGLHDHSANIDPGVTYVNFLKYNDLTWKVLGQNRVQYHNRLRYSDFLRIFQEESFEVLHCQSKVDESSLRALETMRVAKRFKDYEKRDLATYTMTICARKRD